MNYLVPSETLHKVIDYLVTRPFSEVSTLLSELQSQSTEIATQEAPASIDSLTQPEVAPAPNPINPLDPVASQESTDPTAKGGIENVQSESSEASQETTSETTNGEEGNGQEAESSNQG
jgi:hypothetical protein